MKKLFVFAALAALTLAACQKAPKSFIDPDEVIPEGTLVPVLFGSNVQTVKATTKSFGGVEKWNAAQTVYIYGIARPDRDSDALDLEDILINNIPAAAPADGTSGEIEVYDPVYSTEDVPVPFYYDLTKCYDFFGYYVDDMEVTPEIDAEVGTLTVPVTINGSQDVMLATAERTDQVANGVSVGRARLFSAYSARKNLHPTLKFEHQLARFKFIVTNGNIDDALYDAENPYELGADPSDNNLTLSELYVESLSEGILTIVGGTPGLEPVENSELNLYLKDSLAADAPAGTELADLAAFSIQGKKQPVGESLLVMPGATEYPIGFYITQAGYPRSVLQTETIRIPGGALAGKQYTIHLTLYGLEQVKISVELTEWDVEEEEIPIGQDEDDPQPEAEEGEPENPEGE